MALPLLASADCSPRQVISQLPDRSSCRTRSWYWIKVVRCPTLMKAIQQDAGPALDEGARGRPVQSIAGRGSSRCRGRPFRQRQHRDARLSAWFRQCQCRLGHRCRLSHRFRDRTPGLGRSRWARRAVGVGGVVLVDTTVLIGVTIAAAVPEAPGVARGVAAGTGCTVDARAFRIVLVNRKHCFKIARMFPRHPLQTIEHALARQASVALIGPRQVGKTTLALTIAEQTSALYLDLELPQVPGGPGLWAIEIKRALAPRVEKGFHSARADLAPTRSWVIYPGEDRFPLAAGVEAIGLRAALTELAAAADPQGAPRRPEGAR
jgi:hypothetical protein